LKTIFITYTPGRIALEEINGRYDSCKAKNSLDNQEVVY
jgi:hypothetical protein